MKAFLREMLTIFILAVVIALGLQVTVQHSVVVSQSMAPNLQVGQHLIINKVVYKFHEPKRGDIIVFHSPVNQQDDYIKRLIGLSGESIEIKNGTVYIRTKDGSILPLNESYISKKARQSFAGETIPENEYFVLGDNRNNSSDSRSGWTLPQQDIVGKAWLSIWPPEEWGLVANYPLQEQIANATDN